MYYVFRILFLSSFVATNAWADWGDGQVIYDPEPSFVYEGTGDITVTGASLTNAGSMFSSPSAKASSAA